MRHRISFVVLFAAAVSSFVSAQASDLRIGTWKLNVGKSTFSPGPAPKSQTLIWEPSEGGFKFTVDTVDGKGQKMHSEMVAKADGQEYPVTGAESPTTRVYKRINDRTWDVLDKVNGKVTLSRKEMISLDGKILTVISAGTNAEGQKINNEAVYTKQ